MDNKPIITSIVLGSFIMFIGLVFVMKGIDNVIEISRMKKSEYEQSLFRFFLSVLEITAGSSGFAIGLLIIAIAGAIKYIK